MVSSRVRPLSIGGPLVIALAAALLSSAPVSSATTHSRELSYDVWDWTRPAADLALFETWAEELSRLGFNRLELSVPWKVLEPEPGRHDLTWLRERAAICRRHRLGMRLRINSYLGRAVPSWYKGSFWMDADGTTISSRLPSISDEEFWKHYAPLCTAIARELRGQDVLYNAFIGVHAELKYGNWWSFDPASLELWRKSIARPRPPWLSRVVGEDCDLPTTPPVPASTSGYPDLSPASRAFITFREWTWRRAVERFRTAIRAGDPEGRISAPLGESFRRESAMMSNLDYWGCSRGCEQVVHSYDFFLHPGGAPPWHAAASIAAFQGITQLPVVFEFDSPTTLDQHGHTLDVQRTLARTAWQAGAGLKFANFSYFDRLPQQWPILEFCGKEQKAGAGCAPPAEAPARGETVLLFFSKWANYSYREPTEWLHEAQFGWWKLLRDCEIPVRIICEDNLGEDLSGYRALVSAFSPPELMPAEDRQQLDSLPLPMIRDHGKIPTRAPGEAIVVRSRNGDLPLRGGLSFPSLSFEAPGEAMKLGKGVSGEARRLTLGFPPGYYYFHGEESRWREFVRTLLAELAPPSAASVLP